MGLKYRFRCKLRVFFPIDNFRKLGIKWKVLPLRLSLSKYQRHVSLRIPFTPKHKVEYYKVL